MIYKKSVSETQAFTAGDHTFLRELLHPANDPIDIPFSIAHASLEKGASSLPHTLQQSEIYYLLQGSGRLHVDEEEVALTEGDLAVVPGGKSQYFENTGPGKVVFLCIVSPPWSAEGESIP